MALQDVLAYGKKKREVLRAEKYPWVGSKSGIKFRGKKIH